MSHVPDFDINLRPIGSVRKGTKLIHSEMKWQHQLVHFQGPRKTNSFLEYSKSGCQHSWRSLRPGYTRSLSFGIT